MDERTAASRDLWDSRYAAAAADDATVWSLTPNAWVAEQAAGLPVGTAVDLGAGEGRNALWLASRGWVAEAVDFSEAGLGIGRRRASEAGLDVRFTRADATTWQPDSPVDLVVVAYLQLPRDLLVLAVRGALRALAPGGLLLLVAHDRDNLVRGTGGPQDPKLLTTVGELAEAADVDGTRVLACEQVERVLPDGRVAIDVVLRATASAG